MSGGRRYRGLLDEYGARFVEDICKVPFLSRKEDALYCRLAKKGDSEARKMLLLSNSRRVVQLAYYFARKCSRLDLFLDFIVDGLVGLNSAIDRFEPARGYRFNTYGLEYSLKEMRRNDNLKDIVRVPYFLQQLAGRAGRYIDKYFASHGIKPTNGDVAKALGSKHGKDLIARVLRAYNRTSPVSIDALAEDGKVPGCLSLRPEPEIREELPGLEQALRTKLSLREQMVVRLHYGLGCQQLTLKEIGKLLNRTNERARQIELRALVKLRKALLWQKSKVK
jgi:RNA polymerase primary sigma factor